MYSFIDNEFINRIVRQYSDMIFRIAIQYTKNRADAEDIMQEVFFSLIKKPFFNSEEHLKAWLIRVTINRSKNYLKALKKRNTVALSTVENYLTEKQSIMLDELQELSEKDRNIIYLFYYEGYKAKEIADILGKKEKAVLMCLSRARARLKVLLEDKNEN